ncbi:MAG: hypothetical protein K2J20_02290 [Bacilli bacterium]|nr:hypothetical protein [Bacilli bacterium]
MEELMQIAVMLIYPDGTVEKKPISSFEYHAEYLREHMECSSRFEKLCRGLDFGTYLHGHIDSFLAIHGVMALYNLDIMDIVQGCFNFQDDIPTILVSLPENVASAEQLNAFMGVWESYPHIRLNCDVFSEKLDQYHEMKDEEVQKYIIRAQEKLIPNR